MSSGEFRHGLESSLGQLGRAVQAHPWFALLGVALFFSVLASPVRHIQTGASFDAMLRKDDPARVQYDAFRERFGRDELLLLAFRPADVFDAEFLNTLRAIHLEMENEVPYIAEVTSLINVRETRGTEAGLVVDDLLAEIRDRETKGERVLVTTLTKRMAEDLSEYLQSVGVRVRYMHSFRVGCSA